MRRRLEETLAVRLREIAAAKKVPLSHVADRAGVARSYFWRLLDGDSSATLDLVQRLAEALDVPPMKLLVEEAAPSTSTREEGTSRRPKTSAARRKARRTA